MVCRVKQGRLMRIFCPVNSLVVSRNLWLILLSKIWLFLDLVKRVFKKLKNSKDLKSALIFFSSFSGCWVFSNFVIFHLIKVAKYIRDTYCHLATETDSWFPLIVYWLFWSFVDMSESNTASISHWKAVLKLKKKLQSAAMLKDKNGPIFWNLNCEQFQQKFKKKSETWKLFCSKSSHSDFKLDHFIIEYYIPFGQKWPILQKRVSTFALIALRDWLWCWDKIRWSICP